MKLCKAHISSFINCHSLSYLAVPESSSRPSKSPTDSNQGCIYRSRLRNYPGRPQLQKISSNCQDSEYETKIEKFQVVLDSPQLDLVALKKISWSGVPRKVRTQHR